MFATLTNKINKRVCYFCQRLMNVTQKSFVE